MSKWNKHCFSWTKPSLCWISLIFHVAHWLSMRGESPQEHLVMSGNIFGCYKLEGCPWISYPETRDVAKHPIMHRTAFYNKELSRTKYQQCQGWETLKSTNIRNTKFYTEALCYVVGVTKKSKSQALSMKKTKSITFQYKNSY